MAVKQRAWSAAAPVLSISRQRGPQQRRALRGMKHTILLLSPDAATSAALAALAAEVEALAPGHRLLPDPRLSSGAELAEVDCARAMVTTSCSRPWSSAVPPMPGR